MTQERPRMTETNNSEDKAFPAYGCSCDLNPGEALTDCVVNEGSYLDCDLAVTSWTKNRNPRIRRSPNSCKYWVRNQPAGKARP